MLGTRPSYSIGITPLSSIHRPVLGPRLASPATRLSEKIDNHTYVLKPFSEEDQGSYSETYEIKGGFKTNSEDGVPAILKIIK